MFFGQSEVWTADKHPATGNLISAAYHLNMEDMTIFIRGPTNQKYKVRHLKPEERVQKVMELLRARTGLELDQQNLRLGDRRLMSNETLGECGVQDGAILHLSMVSIFTPCPTQYQAS